MCGIVGIASCDPLSMKDTTFFTQALLCDQLRGSHSTGVFSVRGREVSSYKKALQASDFIQMKAYERLISRINPVKMLVGHNRYATQGSIVDDNAHPFTYGNITMVHNGVLRDYGSLKGYNKYRVDSDVLCQSISEIGIEETLAKITGDYTLVWYDKGDGSINFIRNSGRPLAYTTGREDESGIYFTSEKGMLSWLLERNGIKTGSIESLIEDTHVKLTPQEGKFVLTKKEVKQKKPQIFTRGFGGNGGNSLRGSNSKSYQACAAILQKEVEMHLKVHDKPTYMQGVTKILKEIRGITKGPDNLVVTAIQEDPKTFVDGRYKGTVSSLYYDNISGSYRGRVTKLQLITPASKEGKNVLKKSGSGTGDTHLDDAIQPYLVERLVEGPNGRLISLKYFNELAKYGCGYCSCDITGEDSDKGIVYWENDTPICNVCKQDIDEWEENRQNNSDYPINLMNLMS